MTTHDPIFGPCGACRDNVLRRHLRLTWEDYVFGVITLAIFLAPRETAFFHFYTVGVIILVISLGFRRGLAVSLVRMIALGTGLLLLHGTKAVTPRLPLLELAALSGGGLIAGGIGEMQRKSQEALQRSFCQTLEVLARALECRDPYTEGHSRRTARYAAAIAQEMGMDEEATTIIERAGLLHDLGKMGMPDAVLHKHGTLTPEEQRLAMRHPEEGSRILQDIPFLAMAAVLVRHHHEHFDGSGYPDKLAGPLIPIGARILTVADVFDALTTDRPYRKASSPESAIQQIRSDAGRLFDPQAVQALERTWRDGKVNGIEMSVIGREDEPSHSTAQ